MLISRKIYFLIGIIAAISGSINPSKQVAQAQPPTGVIDSISCNTIRGWAWDRDAPNTSIKLHIYANNLARARGKVDYIVNANLNRPDLVSIAGDNGKHGFEWSVPDFLKSETGSALYIYAIDATGKQNTLLSKQPIILRGCQSKFRNAGFFKIADSANNGYTYGYAPTIIKENGIYHTFYCSNPELGAGIDAVRYVYSEDALNWSNPKIVLRAKPSINSNSGKWINRSACDPSLVYYKGYYYLYYTNQHQTGSNLVDEKRSTQGNISVARASKISGPYLTYTERRTWEENPPDAKIIIFPQVKRSGNQHSYGAGQQTVVVKDGELYMWFTDDSIAPLKQPRIYFLKSQDPVNWTAKPVPTNLANTSSIDIKYDDINNRFILIKILDIHTKNASLVASDSTDGINWKNLRTIYSQQNFPAFAHNIGMSGNKEGHFVPGEHPIVAFGAPYALSRQDTWGAWDLFGVRADILKAQ